MSVVQLYIVCWKNKKINNNKERSVSPVSRETLLWTLLRLFKRNKHKNPLLIWRLTVGMIIALYIGKCTNKN